VTGTSNPLGSFSFSYLGQTGQVQKQQLAKGFAIDLRYEDNPGDRRLKAIVPEWRFGLGAKAHFYKTAPEDLILAHGEWPGKLVSYQYDDAYRLVATGHRGFGGEGPDDHDRHGDPRNWGKEWEHHWLADLMGWGKRHRPEGYRYDYDAADNLTQVATPDSAWSGTVNTNNQYGTAKGAAWRYDAAGNVLDDGEKTYSWDAAHRLISMTDKATGKKSEFAYDGQSRLTVRKDYASATASPSEIRYLWCGDQVCQSRDSSDSIAGQYYGEGEIQGTTALYYVKDHLGSVTDVVNGQGRLIGQLDYGPYGEVEKAEGRLPDKRYAGMLYHAPSGDYVTHYRFYDPETGRWLNRDPIGEDGGLNLYGYVGGNPASYGDLLGLMANVVVNGNNVTITVPITYTGNAATPAAIANSNQSISNQWSGQFGNYSVSTVVVAGQGNIINLQTGNGTSYVQGGNSGTWFIPGQGNQNWEAGHECGHLMGLPDRYIESYVNGVRVTTPISGYQNNVMGAYGQTGVTAQDISNIIQANSPWYANVWNTIKGWF
jgi:RHS repeat-associated protein